MSTKSLFFAGVIIVVGAAFFFWRSLTQPHTDPSPTPTPSEVPNLLACVPHCTDAEKHQLWEAYRTNGDSQCELAKDLPPETLAVSFSQLIDGHKALESIAHHDSYQCGEELYIF